MKKKILTFMVLLATLLMNVSAQETQLVGDKLMDSGKIYAVITVISIILLGISVFLIRLDRKVSRLEQK